MSDVYEFFEQKKLVGIRSDTGTNQDAAEFRDLSELTISDFFKRLSTPERE